MLFKTLKTDEYKELQWVHSETQGTWLEVSKGNLKREKRVEMRGRGRGRRGKGRGRRGRGRRGKGRRKRKG